MKINNSEILNKVKEKVSENKQKLGGIKDSKIIDSNDSLESELKKWINENAEKIAKDIIKEEVKENLQIILIFIKNIHNLKNCFIIIILIYILIYYTFNFVSYEYNFECASVLKLVNRQDLKSCGW